MEPNKRPRLHGRDHLEGGADPIPGLPVFAGGGNYGDYVLGLGSLLAYYPLQEASGDVNAADHSGHMTQAPSQVSPPPPNLTYEIDGPGGTGLELAIDFESAYGDADAGGGKGAMFENTGGDSVLTSTTSILTGCAWVKPNATQDAGDAIGHGSTIFGTLNGVFGTTSGWGLTLDTSLTFQLIIGSGPGGGVGPLGAPRSTALVPDVWSFIAYTFDTSTQERKLYINGTVDDDNTTDYVGGTSLPGGGTADAFSFASTNTGAAFVDRYTYYRGGMAGVALFSSTLSDGEIAAMYAQGIGSQIQGGKVLEADGLGSSAFLWPNMRILASDPSSPNDGEFYFNSGDSSFRVWDGSAWVKTTLS